MPTYSVNILKKNGTRQQSWLVAAKCSHEAKAMVVAWTEAEQGHSAPDDYSIQHEQEFDVAPSGLEGGNLALKYGDVMIIRK